MANYRKDPNNSQSLVPGPLPDTSRDRYKTGQAGKFMKTPNYVYISKTIPANDSVSFYFKPSASFSTDCGDGSPTQLLGVSSSLFTDFGMPTVGTTLHIHPTAFSSSNEVSSSIKFVYSNGLNPQRP